MSAPTIAQTPSSNPQHNAALATAMVTGQSARQVSTQTVRAAAAVPRGDASRETKDGTFTGHSADSEATAIRAQSPGRRRDRGGRLDVTV